ncbi:hypothetical protein BDR07DRAFT_1031220 [Suillus spraguei]|nr:hypothetical protein BDR07DRAFT_1031220 [Suillus spraguei]
MVFYLMSRSPSPPPDDELAVSDSLYYQDHPNTMSSFNLSGLAWTSSPYFASSTSANIQARRYPGISRARTGTSSNVSSNEYYREEATANLFITDNIAWSQNYHPTTDSIPYESYDIDNPPICPVTYELQYSSGYGSPAHNSPSYPGAQYYNTAQRGINASYPRTPVTGSNLPQPTRYLDDCTPDPPKYASPIASSSSYHWPSASSFREPFFKSFHEPSSHHCEPSIYSESSVHYPGMYHGSWPQCEDPIVYDSQVAGSSSPERPGLSTVPLPSAAISTHPYIDHGDDISNASFPPQSIRPHQDLPCRNSRSRQNSQRRGRSRPYPTHHSPSTTFCCGWLIGENKTCEFEGPLHAFKIHFRHSHLSGTQDAPNVCRWQGCNYRKRDNADINVMRCDSVRRHVWEIHLGIKRNA